MKTKWAAGVEKVFSQDWLKDMHADGIDTFRADFNRTHKFVWEKVTAQSDGSVVCRLKFYVRHP